MRIKNDKRKKKQDRQITCGGRIDLTLIDSPSIELPSEKKNCFQFVLVQNVFFFVFLHVNKAYRMKTGNETGAKCKTLCS